MAKRILVVDDSSIVRDHLKNTLSLAQYEVIEASNGQEALSLLDAQIDLIISDVNMPVMDGLTFSQKVRDNHFKCPIFLLTSESNQEFKNKAKAIGVTAWFLKPYKAEVILDAIRKFIGNTV